MAAANSFLNNWGPDLVMFLTVVVGLFYQNTRMNDLKDAMNAGFDDMKDYMKSEFKRVDERIDRIDSGLIRK